MELWRDDQWEDSPDIYDLKDVSVKPVILRNIPVIYPNDAAEKKLSGKVVVKVVINERGFVIEAEIYKGIYDKVEISMDMNDTSDVIIKKSNAVSTLDTAALEAAKTDDEELVRDAAKEALEGSQLANDRVSPQEFRRKWKYRPRSRR